MAENASTDQRPQPGTFTAGGPRPYQPIADTVHAAVKARLEQQQQAAR